MITRIAEWHRIVNPQPSSTTIDQRTAAIHELIKTFDESTEWEVVLSSVAGVIGGFENGYAQDSVAVQKIVAAIKDKDSAFPQDLKDNALELRAVAATAIGEIIVRNPDKPPDDAAVLLSLVVESGMGLRPQPPERYIAEMLSGLHSAARKTLATAQQFRRPRFGTLGKKVLSLEDNPTDALASVKAIVPALKSTVKEMVQQSAIDREELEVLWWLFGGASTTTGKQLSEMAPGAASLAIGVEIAELCILPPSSNAGAFVFRALEHVKKAGAKRAFEKIIDDSDETTRAVLIRNDDAVDLGKRYPVLFPITWLCGRLCDSSGTAGWDTEFNTKTKLSAAQSLDLTAVALQAFRERISQRQYESLTAE